MSFNSSSTSAGLGDTNITAESEPQGRCQFRLWMLLCFLCCLIWWRKKCHSRSPGIKYIAFCLQLWQQPYLLLMTKAKYPQQAGISFPGLVAFWHEEPELSVWQPQLKISWTYCGISQWKIFPLGTRIFRSTKPRFPEMRIMYFPSGWLNMMVSSSFYPLVLGFMCSICQRSQQQTAVVNLE